MGADLVVFFDRIWDFASSTFDNFYSFLVKAKVARKNTLHVIEYVNNNFRYYTYILN